ncbi:FAD-binding protein [Actinocrispum wychmicini]|uniref:FAD/FMN-containing dehydrogenase n=1 Tax=Actinocrispum wychmicini TaxID=1213861 RepID=A0A4R2J3V5_9PSEU|nr:FAD-binding protein [Actinocrispum wychmicini]TCO52337.1 FAD/FMN-containing dehydrogenase [Actinocrispum wychmicini]
MSDSAHSRRNLLKGIGVGAVVVGWSALDGSWVTAEAAPAASAVVSGAVPPLDGTLETSPEVLANFAGDFGGLVTGAPWAVLRPGSTQDIVKMVRFARCNGLKIAVSGRGGSGTDIESHSSYGQAEVPGGIAVDARALGKIYSIGNGYAVVGAGVTLWQLSDAALKVGQIPPSMTDYLPLSVGGVASLGGFGGTVFKYGLFNDNVLEMDVVTGEGTLVTGVSATNRPELFHAVLGGAGQVAIIVKAKVRLIPAPSRAKVYNLYYQDVATYQADQEKLLADGRFHHQSGTIQRKPDNSGWWYAIEAATFYNPPATPNDNALLRGLHDDRASMTTGDQTFREWTFRVDPFEQFWKDGGYWAMPHPWLSLFIPASAVKPLVTAVVAELTPEDLGGGFGIVLPVKTSKLTHPLVARPNEPVAYLFDLLRMPNPGDPNVQTYLQRNRKIYDLALTLGAKRYLVGAIPGMTQDEWRRHFGSAWPFLVAMKRRYDPDSVLTPGQGFFG